MTPRPLWFPSGSRLVRFLLLFLQSFAFFPSLFQSSVSAVIHSFRREPFFAPDRPSSASASADSDPSTSLAQHVETAGRLLAKVREQVGSVILGQQNVIDLALTTLLASGHVLLIGVPGLGKTRLVETLSVVLGLAEKRIQCTPDLMPADILGSEVLEENEAGRRSFRFIPGPVFCQLLMADEVNRASPRTQSALLQAMQERRVSVAGHYHPLPEPFHVLATQNPLEQEGTYPLPEAQLDRFLMQIDVGYPDSDAERRMMIVTTGAQEHKPVAVLKPSDLRILQDLVRRLPTPDSVVGGILSLVRSGRPEISSFKDVQTHVAWGPGPRASQAFMLAVRARALLDGRLAPSLDDVLTLAKPILRHRMALNFAARADGVTLDALIDQLCKPLQ
ncbi:MoxR-like ATPase [Azospirillaceae bacterium]